MRHKELSDADLLLYLAGALPLKSRLGIRFACLMSPGLRTRIQILREADVGFRQDRMPALRSKLGLGLGQAPTLRYRGGSSTQTGTDMRWGLVLPGLALLALGVYLPINLWNKASEPQFVAKGLELGAHLYRKHGGQVSRVEGFAGSAAPGDTFQFLPMGEDKQYLALFATDDAGALNRLFPTEGGSLAESSAERPPQSLVYSGGKTNLVICVSSATPRPIGQVHALLESERILRRFTKGGAWLQSGLYIQAYTLHPEEGI